MACVYRHIRLDKNEPFYIGIGKDIKRAYNVHKRSNPWKGIVEKYGYVVEILFEDLTWDEACLKEIEFISLYGRKANNTGTLVNMTNGGEGAVGYKHTDESLLKISNASKGRIKSVEQIQKWKNKMNFNTSEETKEKIKNTLLNKKHTIERRMNQSKSHLGKKLNEETKNKISLKLKGVKKPPISEETRKKMVESRNNYILNQKNIKEHQNNLNVIKE